MPSNGEPMSTTGIPLHILLSESRGLGIDFSHKFGRTFTKRLQKILYAFVGEGANKPLASFAITNASF